MEPAVKNMINVIVGVTALLVLSSCMPSTYSGPGTQRQFLEARYQCLREAKTITNSYGGYGLYGGGLNVYSGPSCGELASCMALKGYTMDEKGKFSVPPDQEVRCVR